METVREKSKERERDEEREREAKRREEGRKTKGKRGAERTEKRLLVFIVLFFHLCI